MFKEWYWLKYNKKEIKIIKKVKQTCSNYSFTENVKESYNLLKEIENKSLHSQWKYTWQNKGSTLWIHSGVVHLEEEKRVNGVWSYLHISYTTSFRQMVLKEVGHCPSNMFTKCSLLVTAAYSW